MAPLNQSIRLDQWLWRARFFKSRTLAGTHCKTRKVRVDGVLRSKSSVLVSVGQVLTFHQGRHIRVVKILTLPSRRGPAIEARDCYDDLTPAREQEKMEPGQRQAERDKGTGRPSKRERRITDRLRRRT